MALLRRSAPGPRAGRRIVMACARVSILVSALMKWLDSFTQSREPLVPALVPVALLVVGLALLLVGLALWLVEGAATGASVDVPPCRARRVLHRCERAGHRASGRRRWKRITGGPRYRLRVRA